MKYTGIRTVPFTTPRRIMQPHLARYVFVAQKAPKAHLVLDIACGTGYGMSALESGKFQTVLGADIDWSAVSYAKTNFALHGEEFLQADGCRLPFANDTFDLVTSFETLEHMLDYRGFLCETCRILRPDGVLIVSVPNAPIWAPFSSPPDLSLEYIRTGYGHKHDFSSKQFYNLILEFFDEVAMFGQDFRRCSWLGKIFRQLERGFIFLKYRLAEIALPRWCRQALQPVLRDVLPYGNLNFVDEKWRVTQDDRQGYEPLFAIAVCRKKTTKFWRREVPQEESTQMVPIDRQTLDRPVEV
jgi:SAM-dependent methyltransferase